MATILTFWSCVVFVPHRSRAHNFWVLPLRTEEFHQEVWIRFKQYFFLDSWWTSDSRSDSYPISSEGTIWRWRSIVHKIPVGHQVLGDSDGLVMSFSYWLNPFGRLVAPAPLRLSWYQCGRGQSLECEHHLFHNSFQQRIKTERVNMRNDIFRSELGHNWGWIPIPHTGTSNNAS